MTCACEVVMVMKQVRDMTGAGLTFHELKVAQNIVLPASINTSFDGIHNECYKKESGCDD